MFCETENSQRPLALSETDKLSPKTTEYDIRKYKMNCLEILLFRSARNALYYRRPRVAWCGVWRQWKDVCELAVERVQNDEKTRSKSTRPQGGVAQHAQMSVADKKLSHK